MAVQITPYYNSTHVSHGFDMLSKRDTRKQGILCLYYYNASSSGRLIVCATFLAAFLGRWRFFFSHAALRCSYSSR